MAEHIVGLSAGDVAIIQKLIDESVGRRQNQPLRGERMQIGPYRSDIYIAYPPAAGIPPLERADTVGTAVPGTGTGQFDRPGSADCDIYNIRIDTAGIPEIQAVPNFTARKVYNLTTTRIAQDWIQLVRSKYGQWLAVQGGSGCISQNAIMDVTIIGSPTSGTFDMTLTVNSSAEVLTFSYNDATAEVKTELETHTEIDVGDVVVTAGPFSGSTMRIEFTGLLANTNIALPTVTWTALGAGVGTATATSTVTDATGIAVIVALAQLGIV